MGHFALSEAVLGEGTQDTHKEDMGCCECYDGRGRFKMGCNGSSVRLQTRRYQTKHGDDGGSSMTLV